MSISLPSPSVALVQAAAGSKPAPAGKAAPVHDSSFTQMVSEQVAALDGKGKTDGAAQADKSSQTGKDAVRPEAEDGKDIRPDPATLAAMLGTPVPTEPVRTVVDATAGEQAVAGAIGTGGTGLTGKGTATTLAAPSADEDAHADEVTGESVAARQAPAPQQAQAPAQDGGKTRQDVAAASTIGKGVGAATAGQAALAGVQGGKAQAESSQPAVESKQPLDFGSELQAAAKAGAAASAATAQQVAPALAHVAGNQPVATAQQAAPAPLALQMQQPLSSPQWGQELGQHVALLAQHKLDGARLQINPEKMGPVEVTLKFGAENQLTLNFVSAVPNTRDALEQNLPRLAQQLAGQGIQLADAQVSSGQRDQNASAFMQQGGQSSSGRGDSSFSLDGDANVSVTATTVGAPVNGRQDGRVSVFA